MKAKYSIKTQNSPRIQQFQKRIMQRGRPRRNSLRTDLQTNLLCKDLGKASSRQKEAVLRPWLRRPIF